MGTPPTWSSALVRSTGPSNTEPGATVNPSGSFVPAPLVASGRVGAALLAVLDPLSEHAAARIATSSTAPIRTRALPTPTMLPAFGFAGMSGPGRREMADEAALERGLHRVTVVVLAHVGHGLVGRDAGDHCDARERGTGPAFPAAAR